MERIHLKIVALVLLSLTPIAFARADDNFLDTLSQLAKREVIKQLRTKPIHFVQGAFEGSVQAVDPETRLETTVKDFNLGNDLLTSTLVASGRFKVEGKSKGEAALSVCCDIKLTVSAEARFTKEGEQFFVEPKIKNMEIALAIAEVSPEQLTGGEELLASLLNSAFEKHKEKIIAEANRRIGKRRF